MGKLNLTPWFHSDVKPVHIGVYEVKKTELGQGFALFDGEKWGHLCRTVDQANGLAIVGKPHQDKKWRGIRK